MKTYKFIFWVSLCLIILNFGCKKKLDEGGYKPRRTRAIEATWGIHLFLKNNNDFTKFFRDSCACNLIIGNGYPDEGLEFFLRKNNIDLSARGEYNLINDRTILELKTTKSYSNHCAPFLENKPTQWKILRYTNYNFWLEYNDGNAVYYLELIKISNDT